MLNKDKLKKYFEYLYCPVCSKKFKRVDLKRLTCLDGKHSFPVKDGIPQLISNKLLDGLQRKTQESFSNKWLHPHLKDYGLGGATVKFQKKWYLKRYGWKNEKDFKNFITNQKLILDAGCGSGWAAKWFVEKNPESVVFAVDLSGSTKLVARNFESSVNLFSIQADIAHLPFPEKFFDFISCDQVLHHTSNPRVTFHHLISRLKKGGVLATYVYKEKALLRELADIHIREITTNMKFKSCYDFSRAITLLGRSLSRLNIKFSVQEDIPLLNIKRGRYDLQRFIYWHFLKCFWNEEWGLNKSIMTNFDWYHPKNAYRYKPEEIRKWLKEENLKIINFYVDEAGISIRVKKQL